MSAQPFLIFRIPRSRRQVLIVAVLGSKSSPAGIFCLTGFVTYPTGIRTDIAEDCRVGLKLANQCKYLVERIIGVFVDDPLLLCPAIITVATVGTVEPDFINRTVIGEQFGQLVQVIGDVFRPCVVFMIPVPGREVYAKFQTVLLARIGVFLYHVAFPVLPGRILHRIGIVEFRGPQAEAAMVLGNENEPFKSPGFGCRCNLVGVEFRRVKVCSWFVTVSPLQIGVGGRGKMYESEKLCLMPLHLGFARNGTIGCRWILGECTHCCRSNQQGGEDNKMASWFHG